MSISGNQRAGQGNQRNLVRFLFRWRGVFGVIGFEDVTWRIRILKSSKFQVEELQKRVAD
jgi:hypothetical protein